VIPDAASATQQSAVPDAARHCGVDHAMLHFRIDRLFSVIQQGTRPQSPSIWKDDRKSRNGELESNINYVCFVNFSQSDVPCRRRDGYDGQAYPTWCVLFSQQAFPLKAQ
jgi:hypothetical protein